MQSGRRMVLLRRATIADAQELYRIRYEAYLPQYGAYSSPDCPCVQSEADFVAQIRAGEVYAVTLGDRLVGGLRVRAQEDVTEILELYVQPKFRRTGVAQVALLHAEARCPAARFRARVISGEGAAIALLRKMGYRAQPSLEHPSERVTLLTMEKTAASMVTLELEPL
ncbi:MAG: GNAT family N-acetyltransferase, partial [Candidatus Spyradocola sp.]